MTANPFAREHGASATELVEAALERIEQLNPTYGAFVEVTADAARANAEEHDILRRRFPGSDRGALWGIPTADKDLTARSGVPTRYGSRAFAHNVPEQSDPLALAVDAVGALSVGKTNTSEFGLSGYTEPASAAPARNPWNPSTGAGGSSGGAAVAVATGMIPFAMASDGGGSIRIPAATVGAVGMKPSRGALPVGSGMGTLAGLAVSGAITRTVAETVVVLNALSGVASYPWSTHSGAGYPFSLAAAPRMRVGFTSISPWSDYADIHVSPNHRGALELALAILSDAGHEVVDTRWSPRGFPELFTALWRLSAAEVPLPDSRVDELEPLTAWLVREGRALSAVDALTALQRAKVFERETIADFSDFDIVLTPALGLDPRPIGWYDPNDSLRNFIQQCQVSPFTSFVNVTGLPAVTVPVMLADGGQPVSVQVIGGPGADSLVLAVASTLESTPHWTGTPGPTT